jgi:anti-sigma factor ChrR (cupin superfamily)
MPQCEQSDSAALYGLGLLDEADSRAFEQHLSSCPPCASEVRESSGLAVELAHTLPPAAPPPHLRTRVLREAVLPRGVLALTRGLHRNWESTPYEGVEMAKLYEDRARGELASLVRLAPGAKYPSHDHASLEHCYVIEGDLVFEDHTLNAGDYSAGAPERVHTAATTTHGCLLFIVHNLRDQVHA